MDNPNILKVQNFILTFSSILYEALPFIILGAVIAGILEEMLPQRLITRFCRAAVPWPSSWALCSA